MACRVAERVFRAPMLKSHGPFEFPDPPTNSQIFDPRTFSCSVLTFNHFLTLIAIITNIYRCRAP